MFVHKKESKRRGIHQAVLFALCCVFFLQGCVPSFGGRDALSRAETELYNLRYDLALTAAQEALTAGENAREAYRLMGIAYYKRAQYEEAAEAFRLALQQSDGVATALDYDMNLYLAASLRSAGAYTEALAIYDHILALRPNHLDALYARGVTCLMTDDLTQATADFDRAIAVTPRDFDLRVRIYLAYEEAGYKDTGRAILNEALSSYDAALTNYEKGRFAYYLGNNGEAQSYLERALQSARGNERAQIVLMLGLTGEAQGDLKYARRIYDDFLSSDKTNAEIYNRRGLCLMAEGDYLSAIADFEAGIALNDESVHQALLRNEITAYEYAGNFASARRLMSEYILRYPDDADAVREWAFLSTR